MKLLKTLSRKELLAAVVILLGLTSVGFFFDRGQHATIDFEASSDQKVNCQIPLNWGKASNPRPLTIYPEINNYRFTVRKFSTSRQVHGLSRCEPNAYNISVAQGRNSSTRVSGRPASWTNTS